MARRRRATPRRATTRRAKRNNPAMDFNIKNNLMSAVYGGSRGVLSAYNPLKNMFGGMGQYADEVGMLVGLQGVKALFGRNRQIRNIANLGQQFESAILGFQLTKNMGLLNGSKVEKQGDKISYYG